MPDNDQGAARLHHVVDRLGHRNLVGPVERLAERDQSVRPGRHRGKLLGPGLDPGDVRDVPLPGRPAALGDHRRIGVKTDGALEQVRQPYGEDAGTAPDVQQPPAAVQAEFLSEESLEAGRVRGPTAPVVASRAIIERRVVSHRRTLPSLPPRSSRTYRLRGIFACSRTIGRRGSPSGRPRASNIDARRPRIPSGTNRRFRKCIQTSTAASTETSAIRSRSIMP
jgi:hypothetical protein